MSTNLSLHIDVGLSLANGSSGQSLHNGVVTWMPQVLQLVRFPTMTQAELCQVGDHPLVAGDPLVQVRHLSQSPCIRKKNNTMGNRAIDLS